MGETFESTISKLLKGEKPKPTTNAAKEPANTTMEQAVSKLIDPKGGKQR